MHALARPGLNPLLRYLLVCTLASATLLARAEGEQAQGWAEQYQRAEWVSRVRIESVGSLINPSMSRARLLAVEGYRYRASIMRDWKGEQGGSIRFEVSLSDCRQVLNVDSEYVVFGSRNHRGELRSQSCENLIAVEKAGELLSFLDSHSRARQVVGQASP